VISSYTFAMIKLSLVVQDVRKHGRGLRKIWHLSPLNDDCLETDGYDVKM
jgi:hypothetical protein